MAPNADRNMFTVFASLTAVMAFLMAAVGIIVVVNDDGSDGGTVATSAPVAVSLTEFAVTPDTINVATGGSLEVTNDGSMAHNLAVVGEDLTTRDLNAGQSQVLDLSSLAEGTYVVVCTIPGHEAAGMTGTLVVSGSGGGGGGGETAPAGSTSP